MVAAAYLAQATTSNNNGGFDPAITYLINFGFLGIFVICQFLGLIILKPGFERILTEKDGAIGQLKTDNERLIRERDEALEVTKDQILPILNNFSHTVDSLLPLLQQLIPIMQQAALQQQYRERDNAAPQAEGSRDVGSPTRIPRRRT